MVDTLMVKYGIFNFATDAVYISRCNMVQICLGVAVIELYVFLSHAFILATCLYVCVGVGVCVCVRDCLFFTFSYCVPYMCVLPFGE